MGDDAETSLPPTTAPAEKDNKICILLNATGNVPIIKKRTWTVDPYKTVSWIQKFIHKYLKLDPSEQIFLYVNQTFAPAPDQIIKNLYDCHGTNGKLVLYYCKNQAWG
ncbi:autophagy-related 12 [Haematobia irritans]|uniref:autophagy-related 12 n=1 Tax=Haematobia irritans TaxID=7368 RepID=UPI003F4F603F